MYTIKTALAGTGNRAAGPAVWHPHRHHTGLHPLKASPTKSSPIFYAKMARMSFSRFHSLNQRFGQATAQQPAGSTEWPALYAEGIVDLSPQTWSLEIGGLIGQPKTWSYRDILSLPQAEQNRRLVFAEGWSYRSSWRGILLSDLLAQAQPEPEAQYLIQQNAVGQTECLPLSVLLEGRALLCLFEKQQALSPLYGGPAKLMIFNRYANHGLGQLVRLTLSEQPTPGYWETHGFTAEIEPGNYYAFDLQRTQAHRDAGEATQY